jgi:hypothetical protein
MLSTQLTDLVRTGTTLPPVSHAGWTDGGIRAALLATLVFGPPPRTGTAALPTRAVVLADGVMAPQGGGPPARVGNAVVTARGVLDGAGALPLAASAAVPLRALAGGAGAAPIGASGAVGARVLAGAIGTTTLQGAAFVPLRVVVDGVGTGEPTPLPPDPPLPTAIPVAGLVVGDGALVGRTDGRTAARATITRTSVYGVVLLDRVTIPDLGGPAVCGPRPVGAVVAPCGPRPAPSSFTPEPRS